MRHAHTTNLRLVDGNPVLDSVAEALEAYARKRGKVVGDIVAEPPQVAILERLIERGSIFQDRERLCGMFGRRAS